MANLYSRTYDEKRDFIRMKVDTEVILTVDEGKQELQGYCRDLSGTGMLIEVSEAIQEGAICSTTLPSGNDAFPSLDAKIKVLRCDQIDETTYQLGAEILSIDK